MMFTKTINRSSFDNFVFATVAGKSEFDQSYIRKTAGLPKTQYKPELPYSYRTETKLDEMYQCANQAMRMAAVFEETVKRLEKEQEFKWVNRERFDIQECIRQYCWQQYLSKIQWKQKKRCFVLSEDIAAEDFKRAVFSQLMAHHLKDSADEEESKFAGDKLENLRQFCLELFKTLDSNSRAGNQSEQDISAFIKHGLQFKDSIDETQYLQQLFELNDTFNRVEAWENNEAQRLTEPDSVMPTYQHPGISFSAKLVSVLLKLLANSTVGLLYGGIIFGGAIIALIFPVFALANITHIVYPTVYAGLGLSMALALVGGIIMGHLNPVFKTRTKFFTAYLENKYNQSKLKQGVKKLLRGFEYSPLASARTTLKKISGMFSRFNRFRKRLFSDKQEFSEKLKKVEGYLNHNSDR